MYPLWSTGSLRVSHVVSPYDRASVANLMRLGVPPFKNPTEKSERVSHSSYKVFPPYGLLQFPQRVGPYGNFMFYLMSILMCDIG